MSNRLKTLWNGVASRVAASLRLENVSHSSMPKPALAFIFVTSAIGAAVLGHALIYWQSDDPVRFACYLLVALLASGLKVHLPGIDGTMSVNFLFILLGVLELSLPETLVIGC